MMILAPIAAVLIQAAISRSREFDATPAAPASPAARTACQRAPKIESGLQIIPRSTRIGDRAHCSSSSRSVPPDCSFVQHPPTHRRPDQQLCFTRAEQNRAQDELKVWRSATVEHGVQLLAPFARTEAPVQVDDLDISPSKIGDRAANTWTGRRRGSFVVMHALLTTSTSFSPSRRPNGTCLGSHAGYRLEPAYHSAGDSKSTCT